MLGGEMMSLYEKFFRDNTSVANKWLLEAERQKPELDKGMSDRDE